MNSREIFEVVRQRVEASPERAVKYSGRYCFLVLDGNEGPFELTLGPSPSLREVQCADGAYRVSLDQETLKLIYSGELTPQAAFLSGRLRVEMPPVKALQLSGFFKEFVCEGAS